MLHDGQFSSKLTQYFNFILIDAEDALRRRNNYVIAGSKIRVEYPTGTGMIINFSESWCVCLFKLLVINNVNLFLPLQETVPVAAVVDQSVVLEVDEEVVLPLAVLNSESA